ncbi:MAG: hypothetical protein IJW30_02105 [Clostridia bacterium]|nr:hypothetical protein [Clostridia bacterium]
MKLVVKLSACVMAIVLLVGAFVFFNPVPNSDYAEAHESLLDEKYEIRVLKNKTDANSIAKLTEKTTILSQLLAALNEESRSTVCENWGEITLAACKNKDFVVIIYADDSKQAKAIHKNLEVVFDEMRSVATTKLEIDFEFGVKGERVWFGTPQAIKAAK